MLGVEASRVMVSVEIELVARVLRIHVVVLVATLDRVDFEESRPPDTSS
jgi:hypothetical protein